MLNINYWIIFFLFLITLPLLLYLSLPRKVECLAILKDETLDVRDAFGFKKHPIAPNGKGPSV